MPPTKTTLQSGHTVTDLANASTKTDRKELFWLKGDKVALDVYQIPVNLLYFNIANGRYADKMIQLKADNPGVHIDPSENEWKNKIALMLRGEYPGTESDQSPYQNLRSDMLSKQQLKPGVVLADGGVLDGNRRLAVLLDLSESEKNPTRFEYFDGVILPGDVGAQDRWRIEAGLQIGRDEKLAYSPINQLLKIREGLALFRDLEKPEHEIAKTLYGIPEADIKRDIRKIGLIDEYLRFIGHSNAYNEVGAVVERFEEALKAVDSAKRLSWEPPQFQRLKWSLFAIIRDQSMTNWDMRNIVKSMGSPTGKGKKALLHNRKALDDLLKIADDPKLRATLSARGSVSPKKGEHDSVSRAFVDQMEAHENRSRPLYLAQRAENALASLTEALSNNEDVAHTAEWQQAITSLPDYVDRVMDLAKRCSSKLEKLLKRAEKGKLKKAASR